MGKGNDNWTGTHPFDKSLHASTTQAGKGKCGWHGIDSNPPCDAPALSFRDWLNRRQSVCQRGVDEGVITREGRTDRGYRAYLATKAME